MCDVYEDPQDCIRHHIARVELLKARPSGNGRWSLYCPAHQDTEKSLMLLPNERYGFWPKCHRNPPCKSRQIRDAMVNLGIAQTCLPLWGQKRGSDDDRAARIVAELQKRLAEQPHPVEFMISAAQLLFDLEDDREAALRAGISNGTFYRHRTKCRR